MSVPNVQPRKADFTFHEPGLVRAAEVVRSTPSLAQHVQQELAPAALSWRTDGVTARQSTTVGHLYSDPPARVALVISTAR